MTVHWHTVPLLQLFFAKFKLVLNEVFLWICTSNLRTLYMYIQCRLKLKWKLVTKEVTLLAGSTSKARTCLLPFWRYDISYTYMYTYIHDLVRLHHASANSTISSCCNSPVQCMYMYMYIHAAYFYF